MTKIDIKKGKGLGGLVEEHRGQKVEEEKEVEEGNFNGLLELFDEVYCTSPMSPKAVPKESYLEDLSSKVNVVLNPAELKTFVSAACAHFEILYEEDTACFEVPFQKSSIPNFLHQNFGLFISRLVQVSYDAGFNDFDLVFTPFAKKGFQGEGHRYLGAYIKGTPERKLNLKMKFNSAHRAGCNVENCVIKIDAERATFAGADSRNSSFEMTAERSEYAGCESIDCDYTLKEEVSLNLGNSSNSCTFDILSDDVNLGQIHGGTIILHGTSNVPDYLKETTFKIHKKETIDLFLRKMDEYENLKGVKIIRINPDGSEELVKEYG